MMTLRIICANAFQKNKTCNVMRKKMKGRGLKPKKAAYTHQSPR